MANNLESTVPLHTSCTEWYWQHIYEKYYQKYLQTTIMTHPWAFLGVSYQNILKFQRTISPEVLIPRTFPDTFWKAQNEIFALIITAPSSDEIQKKHY